jgi:ribosomal protein L24E
MVKYTHHPNMCSEMWGLWAPHAFCDYCGKQIDGGPTSGIVSWEDDGTIVFHAHKYDCDRALRHQHPEAVAWCHIGEFLAHLKFNTNKPTEPVKQPRRKVIKRSA